MDTTRLKLLMLKCNKLFKNVYLSKWCLFVYCFDVEFEWRVTTPTATPTGPAPPCRGTPEYTADFQTLAAWHLSRERDELRRIWSYICAHMPRHLTSGMLTHTPHTHTLQSSPSAPDRRWNTEHTLAKQVKVYVYYYYICTVIACNNNVYK